MSFPYFLASKFTAFYDRGVKDPRTSHDFEDICYLLNYTTNLVEQIEIAEDTVRDYLIKSFSDILSDSVKQEAILGNLFYEDQERRYQKIIDKMMRLTTL